MRRTDLQRDFELELASLHRLQDLRNAAVADRSKELAQNPRIHAALEDNALDLLYPSAHDELRDLMDRAPDTPEAAETLHARFYRFLDGQGAVIAPPGNAAGELSPNEEARVSPQGLPLTMQTGYLARRDETGGPIVDELIAVPIRSTESDEVIAALVLGFKPVEAMPHGESTGMKSGILANGKLQLAAFDEEAETQIARAVAASLANPGGKEGSLRTAVKGVPHLLFFKRLNPDSDYPPAYEVCVYPLDRLLARQARLRWQILSAGALLLIGGFVVSQFFSVVSPSRSRNWRSSRRRISRNASARKRNCRRRRKSCNGRPGFPPMPPINSRARSRSFAPGSTRFSPAMVSRARCTRKFPFLSTRLIG